MVQIGWSYLERVMSYRAGKLGDGRRDGRTDGRTDAGNDNIWRPQLASGNNQAFICNVHKGLWSVCDALFGFVKKWTVTRNKNKVIFAKEEVLIFIRVHLWHIHIEWQSMWSVSRKKDCSRSQVWPVCRIRRWWQKICLMYITQSTLVIVKMQQTKNIKGACIHW